MNAKKDELRKKILELTREYSVLTHGANRPACENSAFIPGQSTVPYAGRVFTEDEVEAAVASTLDFWLTLGKEGEAMEKSLASFLGVSHTLLVNSGSSANLLAVSALTTHKLPSEKRFLPGDEVITCAAGFPTTVAPIIQNGLVPVFIDNDPITGNVNVKQLEEAYNQGKTKAVMFAHTLGNPFDLGSVLAFCKKHDLWLIEDNCDALGCTYEMPMETAENLGLVDRQFKANLATDADVLKLNTGAWGDLSTQSFYPPHHLTMGEGGAVNMVRGMKLKSYVESFRDWGRDCWCPSGKDDTCGKRFGWQLGELPKGYDHKYIYSHLGYNLKPLDVQAAIGLQQLKKLPSFIEARKQNWSYLREGLSDLFEHFEFCLPTHATAWSKNGFDWDATACKTDCSWFGFMLMVRPSAPFNHSELGRYLDSKKIGNRMLFGGNLLRQPAFVQLKKDNPNALRVVGDLSGADRIMNEAIFIGTYPGLSKAMMDYMVETIYGFVKSK